MAINFNELPSSKPQNVLPKGYYMATITKAEMKKSKNTNADYLSIQYDLTDTKGLTGKLFDMLMESEKEFLRYKLQRFLVALQLNLNGSFELKDLCKLILNKKLIVDVDVEETEQYGKRNVINSFEHDIYYAPSEWAALTSNAVSNGFDAIEEDTTSNEASTSIAAADALDSAEEY